jgi:hypothetical protein
MFGFSTVWFAKPACHDLVNYLILIYLCELSEGTVTLDFFRAPDSSFESLSFGENVRYFIDRGVPPGVLLEERVAGGPALTARGRSSQSCMFYDTCGPL